MQLALYRDRTNIRTNIGDTAFVDPRRTTSCNNTIDTQPRPASIFTPTGSECTREQAASISADTPQPFA